MTKRENESNGAAGAAAEDAKRARAALIDMRSDTVTVPTDEMREAMRHAEVGDDVMGDDPTVTLLQDTAAKMFGKEAACFVPSGTMGNLSSVMVHCELRGSEMIVGDESHIVIYEQGGSAHLAGVHPRAIPTNADGTLSLELIEAAIRVENDHFPVTRLVCLESSHNKKGGRVLPLEYIDAVGALCAKHHLPLHLDGARVFNSTIALGVDPARYVQACTSVNVCLSKGLGAPVGSLVLGTKTFVNKIRRIRKVLGGGMRQSGVLAAAGLIALTKMPALLAIDHDNARALYEGLSKIDGVDPIGAAPETNMVYAHVADAPQFVAKLKAGGVLINSIDPRTVRFVLHHQVSTDNVHKVLDVVKGTV